MSALPCRAAGGAIVTDIGPLTLAAATELSRFYAAESAQRGRFAACCRERALALGEACAAARQWRKAAGWADPDLADQA